MKEKRLIVLTVLAIIVTSGLAAANGLQVWVSSNNDPTITVEHNFGDLCTWATWDPTCTVKWGDGETTDIDTPCQTSSASHTYSQNGDYTIELECNWNFLGAPDSESANTSVTISSAGPCNNDNNCDAGETYENCPNDCPSVGINQFPTADFTFSPSNPTEGETVVFDAKDSNDPDGDIEKYEWDFDGDGTFDLERFLPSADHTYTSSGSYTVELRVTDNDGATDSATKTLTVGAANQPPQASFTFTPGNPVTGQSVSFDASASTDPDGQITSYSWDFGDGSSGSGESVTHSYQASGSYTVNLTVTDNNGTSDVESKTIGVETANQPPVASFIFSPGQPSVDQIISFDASGSEDPDGRITSYSWDFGDGEGGSGMKINHSYRNPGDIEVTLTVTDNESASSPITKTVKVRPRISLLIEKMQIADHTDLTVDFKAVISALEGLVPQTTTFNYDDGTGPVSYPGLKKEVWHTYKGVGNFTPTVKVKFTDGTVISAAALVENRGDGNLPPIADFSFSPLRPVANESIFFDASDSKDPDGEIEKYEWDFNGDGVFEKEGRVVIHSFSTTGDFKVKLRITDDKGRTATAERPVTVKSVRVSLTVVYKQDPFSVDFKISVSELGGRNVVSTDIDFGDGRNMSYRGLKSSIAHIYEMSGIFEARVDVKLDNRQLVSDTAAVYIQSSSGGYIHMDFRIDESYGAGRELKGKLKIGYTKFIPKDAVLTAYIDGAEAAEKNLRNYLNDIGYYSFKKHVLRYRITENGKDNWATYPEQGFNFSIIAKGTRGSSPTNWTSNPFSLGSSVNGGEGLKFIYDASATITPPSDANNDTVWEVFGNTNPKVNLTMRQACGNGSYLSKQTDGNGWIHRTFVESDFDDIPDTNHKSTNIGGGFDGKSLREPERRFFGGMGGIYKNDVYQEYRDYDPAATGGVYWNAEAGSIIIFQYDATATYKIVYMTPNGPNLCAYTEVADADSSDWTKEAEFDVVVKYNEPFEANYTREELLTIMPPDPCSKPNCRQEVESYEVDEVYDSSNSIDLNFNYSSGILNIQAVTSSPELEREEMFLFDMQSFENLTAPDEVGNHTLRMEISYNGEKLFENSTEFSVCPDIDGDGFCEPEDCDDNNSARHPNAAELCNGIDDDCDGEVDEDFSQPGMILGTPCNDWPGSACSGIWTCSQNRTDVICIGNHSVGELKEVCDDNIDNDCDGKIDELTETVNGTLENGCVFREGEKKVCGSNIGYCRTGFRIFTNGEWSDCMGFRGPREETCNRIDDDCDGIVDNIGGGKEAAETKCWCVNDANPRNEICNDIDDNCNGKIDDGIKCCTPGDKRPCGRNRGICRKGNQMCVNGQWDRKCIGAVEPREEVCYNNLDDDCDGEVDENCDIEITCRNGIMDLGEEGIDCGGPCPEECKEREMSSWLYVSLAGIALILVAGILAFTGRI
jgi:PKD repeat protein